MRQPIQSYLSGGLVDAHFLGLPPLEGGALEMKAAVSVMPLTRAEQQEVIRGQDRMIAELRRRDAMLTEEAAHSLAGSGFRDRWNMGGR